MLNYKQENIERALNLLNTISIKGLNDIRTMGEVFQILMNPEQEEEKEND